MYDEGAWPAMRWNQETARRKTPGENAETTGVQPEGETPVFDYFGTLARLGGSKSLFSELARFFIEDSPVLLLRLQEALLQRDEHSAKLAVHGLKGLIANFGAHRACLAAIDAEVSVRHGNLDEVAAIYPHLETTVSELRSVLSLSQGRLIEAVPRPSRS